MSVEDVTVGFKTFLRPDKLRTCLEHINRLSSPPGRIIVADDSPRKDLNERVYRDYREETPLEVIDLEPDTGLSTGRNRIVDRTDTPYLFIMDDDHYLSPETLRLKQVLEGDPSLGGIAAAWDENGYKKMIAGDITIENGWMIINDHDEPPDHAAGIDYYLYDFIPNSALFRTEALREYSWDDAFIIDGEHEDFYLGHKFQTDWQFSITPNIVIKHDPGPGLMGAYSTDHRMNEKKRTRSREYFVEKWGVKGYLFRGYHYKEHSNPLSRLGARTLYELPPVVQWELKKRGHLDRIKYSIEAMK